MRRTPSRKYGRRSLGWRAGAERDASACIDSAFGGIAMESRASSTFQRWTPQIDATDIVGAPHQLVDHAGDLADVAQPIVTRCCAVATMEPAGRFGLSLQRQPRSGNLTLIRPLSPATPCPSRLLRRGLAAAWSDVTRHRSRQIRRHRYRGSRAEISRGVTCERGPRSIPRTGGETSVTFTASFQRNRRDHRIYPPRLGVGCIPR